MKCQVPHHRDLPVYLICPHCKQETFNFPIECDSHGFPTHFCMNHGAVIAIRSHVRNEPADLEEAYGQR